MCLEGKLIKKTATQAGTGPQDGKIISAFLAWGSLGNVVTCDTHVSHSVPSIFTRKESEPPGLADYTRLTVGNFC